MTLADGPASCQKHSYTLKRAVHGQPADGVATSYQLEILQDVVLHSYVMFLT